MADKLPLFVIFVAAGCVGGFAVFTYFRRRSEYFYELSNFIEIYLSSVMYAKDSVVKIIEDFDTPSKLLKKHLGEYVEHKKNKTLLELSAGYIKKNELNFIKSLLNVLGTSDAATQKNSVGAKRTELNKYREMAEDKFKRYGGSSIKLGLLGGLLVSVICM